jgi:hypothetical protein
MAHSIDGLIKWASRESWESELGWLFEQHLGEACEAFDLEMEELPGVLGEAHFMNLWGCVFEDLVTRDLDGRNIADEYLKRRGWKESAGTRAYIRALRESIMSLYEVSDIRRDEGFFVRDLVRGGEPVWINERSGTHYLAQWDRIAARVMTVNGRMQMAGGLLRFDRAASEQLLAELRQLENLSYGEMADQLNLIAREVGEEVDEEALEIMRVLKEAPSRLMTIEDVLASSAFMFTTFWLRNTLERMLTPRELLNSDGEPIEWIDVHYPLASGATPEKISNALAGIPSLRQETEVFWNWVEEEGALKRRKKEDAKPAAAQIVSRTEDNRTVLGTLDLDGRTLLFSVNSEERAERGCALLEPVLDKLVRKPRIERKSVEDMLDGEDTEADPAEGEDVFSGMSDQERGAVLRRFLDKHYAGILDEPLPVLEGLSPRQAAGKDEHRAKVIDWMKDIENHHARMAKDDPSNGYDCGWIWEELGLSTHRG